MLADELRKFYYNNLTFYSCVIKNIPRWKRIIITSLYSFVILVFSFIYYWTCCNTDFIFIWMSVICISFGGSLFTLIWWHNIEIGKVFNKNEEVKHIYDSNTKNWDLRLFDIHVQSKLRKYLEDENINLSDDLLKLIEFKMQKKEKSTLSSLLLLICGVILTLWLSKASLSILAIKLIIAVMSALVISLFVSKMDRFKNNLIFLKSVQRNELYELLLELKIRDKSQK